MITIYLQCKLDLVISGATQRSKNLFTYTNNSTVSNLTRAIGREVANDRYQLIWRRPTSFDNNGMVEYEEVELSDMNESLLNHFGNDEGEFIRSLLDHRNANVRVITLELR
ncbi:hypothetical protein GGF42_000160 [Coemansia sp. RSA 2424]|nr:hypothetical protein GGF42_000160 [Coemansia sp. RSA 2424]